MDNLNKFNFTFLALILLISIYFKSASQEIVIRPVEINDVLLNPGMGFMTFQRFNGDDLNPGGRWTEGFPIDYQKFDGNLTNKNFPATTIAYWRVYWRFLEPEKGVYRWDMVDKALKTARERGQTLMMRIAPYGLAEKRDILIYPKDDNEDVPDWYRNMVGPNKTWKVKKWLVDPDDPRYAECFGRFISAFAQRYDGHPSLESVDLAIVGAWGEGDASDLLKVETRETLIKSYTGSFKKTPLIALLTDEKTNVYASSQISTGYRVDCIGNLGFSLAQAKDWFHHDAWAHMYDIYPQLIHYCKVQDDWENSPVSFEICSTFSTWLEKGYGKKEVQYIFDQTLKWHMSSFNAKSSLVPAEYEELVNGWLKKMGYRFVLRKFSYPGTVIQNGKLAFKTWWENKGVAPCYKDFIPAIRLKSEKTETILITDANIKSWFPGDVIYDDAVFIPLDFPAGTYDIQIALVDRSKHIPGIKLAIEGITKDGWYQLGKIKIIE